MAYTTVDVGRMGRIVRRRIMEDVKWLLRRCGLPILLLLIFVIAGVFCWGKLHAEKQKVAEEVWEPPIEIENSEAETEEAENAEISTESEQIRDYVVFDEEKQTYYWVRLGCFNYAPTFFGTSLPEVVDIKENEDGTVTLTVEAVCDMVICDDAVITHELTVRFAEDGRFQYLGNEILNDGIMHIPDYQYRIKE